MPLFKLKGLIYTMTFLSALLGCAPAPTNSEDNSLPSFDDLISYLEDGSFKERYIPKPHEVSDFAFFSNSFFTKQTPNASADFERFLRIHPDYHFSGMTLYTDNPGGIPYEEREHLKHPRTYRGSYFKYVCPKSEDPCRFDPERVQRIAPKEWERMEKLLRGDIDEIRIPISDYADPTRPYANVSVRRTKDGRLRSVALSIGRRIKKWDIAARMIGGSGIVVRSFSHAFVFENRRKTK